MGFTFLPQLSAATELFVLRLVAQHSPIAGIPSLRAAATIALPIPFWISVPGELGYPLH